MYESLNNQPTRRRVRHNIPEDTSIHLLRIECVSKETGVKTTVLCKTLNKAKEMYGERFKDFKILDLEQRKPNFKK
jgi:hypothetical protein